MSVGERSQQKRGKVPGGARQAGAGAKGWIYRSGVRFDCPECGMLWRDDPKHSPVQRGNCPSCGGDLKMVAIGANPALVGDAKWFRCLKCRELFMHRRGQLVRTKPRAGFSEFTEF
jgi:predicted RNA-binding Zn-ribbon protein involved in translation (DUF1610 family)